MIRSKITWTICAAAIAGLTTAGCSSDARTTDRQTTQPQTMQQKPASGGEQGLLDPDGMFQRGSEGPLTEDEYDLMTDQERQRQSQRQQPSQRQQQPSQQQGVMDEDGMFERGSEGPLEPGDEQLLTQYRDAEPLGTRRGEATFYDDSFAGQRTASGDVYRPNEMTAASRRYPLGTIVRVVNPDNQQSAIVRINDRLSTDNPDGADIDLSRAAAERIGITEEGRADVRIELLELGN